VSPSSRLAIVGGGDVAVYGTLVHCKPASINGTKVQFRRPRCLPNCARMSTIVQPRLGKPAVRSEMVWIPAGTFLMGSDRHYPEEAPAHPVHVDGFWIDCTPITNREFRRFVEATGHLTFAEIAPDAKDYPGALPHMLQPGSLVFTPPGRPVDLRDFSNWWKFKFGANWRRPYGPRSSIAGLDDHPVVHVAYRDVERMPRGPASSCRPRPNGNTRRAAGSTVPNTRGATSSPPATSTWPTPGKARFRTRT
jgi:formylglycine-generating enzyme required for sulfatase activity